MFLIISLVLVSVISVFATILAVRIREFANAYSNLVSIEREV